MATNLLRQTWEHLDKHELRILLDKRIGGPGQYDGRVTNPDRFYLPCAGTECRVVLTFRDRRIVCVEPGQGFDDAQWNLIAEEIDNSVITGPLKVGREFSFSSYRVQGYWGGQRSGVQILPPPADAPCAPVEMADHPFILEFPIQATGLWPLTNYRRQREHRSLTLLLNVLLAGRTSVQRHRRIRHCWAAVRHDGAEPEIQWVQNSFFAKLGDCVLDTPSPLGDPCLEQIEPGRYFEIVTGLDGQGLRLPADLDESICRYQTLHPSRRMEFDRAAFWLDIASRHWESSVSSSFAALVSAVESLINTRGHGSTGRFRAFLDTYAPNPISPARRNEIYDLRSGILHGGDLMSIDQDLDFGWDPPGWNDRELQEELWTATRTAMRNWLRNPPPA